MGGTTSCCSVQVDLGIPNNLSDVGGLPSACNCTNTEAECLNAGSSESDQHRVNSAYKKLGETSRSCEEEVMPMPTMKFPFEQKAIPVGWQRSDEPAPHAFKVLGGDACVITRRQIDTNTVAASKQPLAGWTLKSPQPQPAERVHPHKEHQEEIERRVLWALPSWAVDLKRLRALEQLSCQAGAMDAKLCPIYKAVRYDYMEWIVIPVEFPSGHSLMELRTSGNWVASEPNVQELLSTLLRIVIFLGDRGLRLWGCIFASTLYLDRRHRICALLPLGTVLSSMGVQAIASQMEAAYGMILPPEIQRVLDGQTGRLRALAMDPCLAAALDTFAASALALWCFGVDDPRQVNSLAVTSRLPELARDLLQKVLFTDPEWRMPAHEALKHPWLRGKGRAL